MSRAGAVVFALAFAGCGSRQTCTVESVGSLDSLPGVCQVIARCGTELVEVECPDSSNPCTCISGAGRRLTTVSHPTCGPEVASELLKICGWPMQ